MSRIDKLIRKLKSRPKDLTWDELVKILNHLGYSEIIKKGKTGGSRCKFVNKKNNILSLHKPHPSHIFKPYIIKHLLEKIEL